MTAPVLDVRGLRKFFEIRRGFPRRVVGTVRAVDDVSFTILEGEIPNPIAPPPGCAFHPRCPWAFEPCRVDVPALIEGGGRAMACHAVEAGRI